MVNIAGILRGSTRTIAPRMQKGLVINFPCNDPMTILSIFKPEPMLVEWFKFRQQIRGAIDAKKTDSIFDPRAEDQIPENYTQKGRDRPEKKRSGQSTGPLQGDLFNANPQTEKQLDLFPVFPGVLKTTQGKGSKQAGKTDSKGKGQSSKGSMDLDQTQRIGVETTGYIQHRGLVVEGNQDVASIAKKHFFNSANLKQGR